MKPQGRRERPQMNTKLDKSNLTWGLQAFVLIGGDVSSRRGKLRQL